MKVQNSGSPPHLIMPDLYSAVHLASTLSLWPLYRYGMILVSLAMLEMESANMAPKVVKQISEFRDQVSYLPEDLDNRQRA